VAGGLIADDDPADSDPEALMAAETSICAGCFSSRDRSARLVEGRMRMRTTFLVGRLTPKSTEIFVAEGSRSPAPFPGPWTLRAVFRPPARQPDVEPVSSTVH